ncbi:hypothetical protein LAZ67_11003234 [Cordylochernes scorpioides]|uniref:Uncharacterized protein n=1 Tax=Cordylochernes scorpioides TaxID=51811 RepID=A0ABY6L0G8_9ARAC|nr:hypothetical protein LAZ67_11003234 [Cordylochernes scorpioides]
MALKGRRFDTRESTIADSKKVLKNIPKYAFSKCFKSWEKRWKLSHEAGKDLSLAEVLERLQPCEAIYGEGKLQQMGLVDCINRELGGDMGNKMVQHMLRSLGNWGRTCLADSSC